VTKNANGPAQIVAADSIGRACIGRTLTGRAQQRVIGPRGARESRQSSSWGEVQRISEAALPGCCAWSCALHVRIRLVFGRTRGGDAVQCVPGADSHSRRVVAATCAQAAAVAHGLHMSAAPSTCGLVSGVTCGVSSGGEGGTVPCLPVESKSPVSIKCHDRR
jgi:hypothetical protein